MMDIEKLQKINMLAKELMQHGICKSMDEAYRQAGRSIESHNPLLLHPDVEEQTMQTVQVEIKQEEQNQGFQKTVFAQSTQQEQQMSYGAFEMRRLQEQISMLEKQMSQIISKMNEMVSEVNKLQTQKNANAGSEEYPLAQQKTETTQTKAAIEAAPIAKKAPETHPRSGNYNPGDVSIEKMFYFGGGGRR